MKNLLTAIILSLLLAACGQRVQPRFYTDNLDSNDSLSIELGNATMLTYHSDELQLDITYPSYLRHQYLADDQMEVFMTDDVSLSFMVMNLDDGFTRSPGQQLMGMGAELVEATDQYSIHTGQDGDDEYYSKVIDDSTRIVTVILRYHPRHADAAAPLRQLVTDFMP